MIPVAKARPLSLVLLLASVAGCARQPLPVPAVPVQTVIVDTDIGDDIDDAFALALALRSPALRVEAVSASFGDTVLRARLLARFLRVAGRSDVPVLLGPPTEAATTFTQRIFAADTPVPSAPFPDAVSGILQRLRTAPTGSVTLVALAPLTTVAALIARDPVAFRRLRQVVMMGGWIRHGYPPRPGEGTNPEPEYNVAADPAGLRALLSSGVPVRIMPLDATMVPLRPADRTAMEGALGAMLETLFGEWRRSSPYPDHPTLFDVVPVAALSRPSLCPTVPMRIEVGDDGGTRPVPGTPNAAVCLSVDAPAVQAMLVDATGKR